MLSDGCCRPFHYIHILVIKGGKGKRRALSPQGHIPTGAYISSILHINKNFVTCESFLQRKMRNVLISYGPTKNWECNYYLRENRYWEQAVASSITCEIIFCLLYINENQHSQLSGKQDFF